MSGLTILRVLTAASVVGLVAILVRLLQRRSALPDRTRAAWTAVAMVELLLSVGYLQNELLTVWVALSDARAIALLRYWLYYPVYFLNAILVAVLPAVLMRTLSPSKRIHAASSALFVAIVFAAATSYALGATSSWESLLSSTSLFTAVGILCYLIMWVLVAAERLPAMDIYLAAFLVMRTLYEIVKPVQEAFFLALPSQDAAARTWHLHLFLQLMQRLAMIATVWLLLGALRERRPPRSVLAPKLSTLRS